MSLPHCLRMWYHEKCTNCVFLPSVSSEVGADEHACGWRHDCPLHVHSDVAHTHSFGDQNSSRSGFTHVHVILGYTGNSFICFLIYVCGYLWSVCFPAHRHWQGVCIWGVYCSWTWLFVTGGEDRIALDSELQKELSIIWPYLHQKNLDLLVPINKGLALAMAALVSVSSQKGVVMVNVVRLPTQILTWRLGKSTLPWW